MIPNGFENLIMNSSKAPAQILANGNSKLTGGSGTSFQNVFSNLMSGMSSKVATKDTIGQKNLMSLMNLSDVSGNKARTVVSALAGTIKQENGVIPSGRFVGAEGFDALKGLLESAGFDKEKVADFIKNMKTESGGKDVSLPQVLSKLGTFIKQNDSSEHLEISALPYIETILNGLGLNQSQVESIMNKAVKDGKGISLDTLASEMQPLVSDAVKMASVKDMSATVDASVLTALSNNVPSTDKTGQTSVNKGNMTVDQLVTRLESLKQVTKTSSLEKSDVALTGESENSAGMFARTFGDNIRNGIKNAVPDTVPVSMKPASNSGEPITLHFDSKLIKNQTETDNSSSWAGHFSSGNGKKDNNLMDRINTKVKDQEEDDLTVKNTPREAAGAFGKVMKEAATSIKEQADSGTVTAKHVNASNIVGTLSDVKVSTDTPVTSNSEKTLPSYVTDQVVRQISKAVKNGDTEIRFQIRPPEMGKVQLSIESTKEGLKVNIMAENHTTRDMIMNQSSELKTILADQGIRLEKINVGLTGDFGQSMTQAGQDGDHSGKERRNREKSGFQLENMTESNFGENGIETLKYIRGNLDLVA